jgi:glycerol transport system ATP-binding protein
MIYVTHDQHEALTFADRVTVMNTGRAVQTGTPEELHLAPASPFVGFFIGSPGMNLLPGRACGGVLECGGGVTWPWSGEGECQLGIRPEFVETSATELPGGWTWEVRGVETRATHKVLALARDGARIKSRVAEDFVAAAGQTVWARFPAERVRVFS